MDFEIYSYLTPRSLREPDRRAAAWRVALAVTMTSGQEGRDGMAPAAAGAAARLSASI